MIRIKPARRSCRLPLEFIFLDILLFYIIIQILSMDCDHWLFDVILSYTSFFNLLNRCNLITWCYWFFGDGPIIRQISGYKWCQISSSCNWNQMYSHKDMQILNLLWSFIKNSIQSNLTKRVFLIIICKKYIFRITLIGWVIRICWVKYSA